MNLKTCITVAAALLLSLTVAGQELTKTPEALLKPFDATKVTIYGVKIGDKADSIPRDKIKKSHPAELTVYTEYVDLEGGYRIGIVRGRVKWLAIANEAAIAQLGLDGRDDIENVFGRPERIEPTSDAHGMRWYYYPSRRMKINGWDEAVTLIVIR